MKTILNDSNEHPVYKEDVNMEEGIPQYFQEKP